METNHFHEFHSKHYWLKRTAYMLPFIIAGIFVFALIVMLLWNAILPELFGFKPVTFWQSLGILVLSKILFGGFHGRRPHRGFHHHPLREKMNQLSPEDQEKLKNDLREHFGKF
ncbi:MAG: hypothetical protein LWX56_12940 [Ignavibacteria bacterium]|nr:hypothetical protein [Ignavibacteria bacterium]